MLCTVHAWIWQKENKIGKQATFPEVQSILPFCDYYDLEQGFPTCGLQPGCGPWPTGHLLTCSSATAAGCKRRLSLRLGAWKWATAVPQGTKTGCHGSALGCENGTLPPCLGARKCALPHHGVQKQATTALQGAKIDTTMPWGAETRHCAMQERGRGSEYHVGAKTTQCVLATPWAHTCMHVCKMLLPPFSFGQPTDKVWWPLI